MIGRSLNVDTTETGRRMDRIFAWLNASRLKSVFHRLFFKNRTLMRMAGLKMPSLRGGLRFGSVYGDLTTVLLAREITRLIGTRSIRRVHEIGVGVYGTLSLYVLRRYPKVALSASTVSRQEIKSAIEVAAMNGCAYECIESDVLDRVEGTFDLIWWNLPYYDPAVESLIDRLCRQIHEKSALMPGGLLLLGFNTVPLDLDRVVTVMSRHPHLQRRRLRTYIWNPHALVLAEYIPHHPAESFAQSRPSSDGRTG